jgi:hypothetical protein
MPVWNRRLVNLQTALCLICRGNYSEPCKHMTNTFSTALATKKTLGYYAHEKDFDSNGYLSKWVLLMYTDEIEAYNKRYASRMVGLRSSGTSSSTGTSSNIVSSLTGDPLELSSWAFSGC